MPEKVMVAMSGGVDSSVAVLVLRQQGYEVCGATLKLYAGVDEEPISGSRTCCSITDVMDARSAAYKLGADHYVFNFTHLFEEEVIRRFGESYAAGETPNPCIDCNRYIKFSKLLERALLMEQDYIATGHYARVERDFQSRRYLLKKPKDSNKDQTYALYTLTQHELSHTLFPLGELTKDEVRELARQHDLINAEKPDSQDICFVRDGDYAGFLTRELGVPSQPGHFVGQDGTILGAHKGLLSYTIGQRKGLGMSFAHPHYVLDKDPVTGNVILGDDSALYRRRVLVGDLNWISVEGLFAPMQVTAKTRYRQKEASAVLYPLEDGQVLLEFIEPQRAPAPGQAAVFYDGDVVVGGGVILRSPSSL